MTDRDTLRSALHAPPQDVLGTPDIDQVMSAGRRLRRRRQLLSRGGDGTRGDFRPATAGCGRHR